LEVCVIFLFRLLGPVFVSCSALAAVPPAAPEKPHEMKIHGDLRQDPYFWMRDRNDPETIKYLKAENAYAEKELAPTRTLQKKLFKEMKSHIKEADETAPVKEGAYVYYSRTLKGKEYPIHFRRRVDEPKSEQVLLDENQLAKGHDYMRVAAMEISDDEKTLAFAVDTKGDRLFTVYFKDLTTGALLNEKIEGTGGAVVWAADNKTVFYAKPEPGTLRSRWIHRRQLGDNVESVVFEEADEKFDVGVERGLSKRLIEINSSSKTASETWTIDASKPEQKPVVFQPRMSGVLYEIADGVDRFYIRTNLKAENFRLMETAVDKTGVKNWKEVVPYEKSNFLDRMLVQKNFLVLQERVKGLNQLRVISRADKSSTVINQKEEDYAVELGQNRDYDAPQFRFSYESLTTPETTIDYDYASRTQTIRKTQEVPGGFDAANYESKRLFAKASDGAEVPISLVYRKGLRKGAATPLLLYGYGSYGATIDSYFSPARLALLDRGFVFAIAHIRGGADLGRPWYLDGKLMKKKNTFTDFIACAEFLIAEKWTSPATLFAKGESAGGLLMGAVMNLRSDLFRGVIAGVPFVDVVTTMLDASIPLTTGEYEEWGNPNEKPAYDYMRSYSPYDNITARAYPNLFVRAGLNDTQVGYWEPAKWVAKLRKVKTDKNVILFTTEMSAGHGGKNGRFTALEKTAMEDAFLLRLVGQGK
jgi:oligopeptidase B